MSETRPPLTPSPWGPEPAGISGGDARSVAFRVTAMLALALITGLALLSVHWYTTSPAPDDLDEVLEEVGGGPSTTLAGGGLAPDEAAVLDMEAFEAGATVVVNGDSVGTTPTRVRLLQTGEQWVVVEQDGETLLDTTVWVWAGDVAVLAGRSTDEPATDGPRADLDLRPPPERSASPTNTGMIRVASTPAGAAVHLDGRRVGVTPFMIERVAPGRYTLVVQRPGYETVRRRVTVRPGTQYEADLALRPDAPPAEPPEPAVAPAEPAPSPPEPPVRPEPRTTMGIVEIRVVPRGQIEINGQVRMLETAALYRTELPPGTHRIRVTHPRLGSQERMVVVDRGVTYRLNFTLDGP